MRTTRNQLWDVARIRGVSHLLGLPQYYEEEEEEEVNDQNFALFFLNQNLLI